VMTAMPDADVQPGTRGYFILLHGFLKLMTGEDARFFGPGFPDPVVNPVLAPILFADLHILAARQARLHSDFEASRNHLDKALIATLSLEDQPVDAVRLIVRVADGLLDDFEVERAVRLVAAATPLYGFIPRDSLLDYEYLQLIDRLAGYRDRKG